MSEIVVKEICADETKYLRHVILRPEQKPEELFYHGDDGKKTFHAGLFLDNNLIGIASVYHEPKPGSNGEYEWRLRGMGVLSEYRRKAYGTLILSKCIEYIKSNDGKSLWCNARINAIEFYKNLGFIIEGDPFEIHGIGQHYLMEKVL